MNIKVTSLCVGNINKKEIIKKELKPNSFCRDVICIPYKEDALLIKVGAGYVDFDTLEEEKDLAAIYKKIDSSGNFQNGCGILRDTIPFFDEDGLFYVDYDMLREVDYPFEEECVSFKKLKKIREGYGKGINN